MGVFTNISLFESPSIMEYWTTLVAVLIVTLMAIGLSKYNIIVEKKKKNLSDEEKEIPFAPGGNIPFLGHALLYKNDPPKFLQESSKAVGPIFKVNLAGKHMIIIGQKCQALRQIAMSPESTCSARDAVAAVGFEQTLGYFNVHYGTDVHKRILKDTGLTGGGTPPTTKTTTTKGSHGYHNFLSTEQLTKLYHAVECAFTEEVSILANVSNSSSTIEYNAEDNTTNTIVPDLFKLIRRIILRVTISRLLGTEFLKFGGSKFLEIFMKFQDDLEDATAKAAVLPRWLALITCLWPVERQRYQLQDEIKKIVMKVQQQSVNREEEDTTADVTTNITMTTTMTTNKRVEEEEFDPIGLWLLNVQNRPIDQIAELIVGLLFAAHKNAAIGAAQAYLFLEEYGTEDDKQTCLEEAASLLTDLSSPSSSSSSSFSCSDCNGNNRKDGTPTILHTCHRLRMICMETLRLTAHSIGGLRIARQNIQLDGTKYAIQKGETIAISHINPNIDETVWGINSSSFDISRSQNELNHKDDYAFTTFSHGVHRCPGQSLALAMMQLTVSFLLSKYDATISICTDDGRTKVKATTTTTLPPICFERATLAQREGPVRILLRQTKDLNKPNSSQ